MIELKQIKTWGERAAEKFQVDQILYEEAKQQTVIDCMRAEISELRAELSRRTQPEATKPAQDLGSVVERKLGDTVKPILTPEDFGILDPELAKRAKNFANAMMHQAALASPADALVAGDRVDAERTGTLYQAVQRAAGELPEGWTICLEIERDAGTVELIDPEGERKLIDGNDGYLCQAVNAATDSAIQAQKDGHG